MPFISNPQDGQPAVVLFFFCRARRILFETRDTERERAIEKLAYSSHVTYIVCLIWENGGNKSVRGGGETASG